MEWIAYDSKWMGRGYINNIITNDVQGYPFRCCRDEHGRLVVLMRRRDDVAVLFQRYIVSDATSLFSRKKPTIHFHLFEELFLGSEDKSEDQTKMDEELLLQTPRKRHEHTSSSIPSNSIQSSSKKKSRNVFDNL